MATRYKKAGAMGKFMVRFYSDYSISYISLIKGLMIL